MTARDQEAILKAAKLFMALGASQLFVFGSAVKGQLRPDSDIDISTAVENWSVSANLERVPLGLHELAQ